MFTNRKTALLAIVALVSSADVFTAAKTLREISSFKRDDDTPLNYTLVNIKDWCKNHFEVVNQLRINTHSSHHRYDVILLMNGVPAVQIGKVGGDKLTVKTASGEFSAPLTELHDAWWNSIARAMA